ncbi:MAG TPA: WYL domain-containing protein [Leptospiraceae bacterium]|nr:WYL domain-containing protein [Leptospiraceae bacterium]HMX32212.1 WYL domain-containing protein [Leptospiraceae bacterium]HMY33028.1 WYL domain-containing protein [Leptospiraceae bacterium]HMZ63514.1 WYL domain-containing protein [Leptospiraceae bacterium]HNA08329.1 WYL domain-containing protein [Leptospiraceae bacterium]
MAKETTTKQERILIALEYACLLFYEWSNGKKKKLEDFYGFLQSFDSLVHSENKKMPDPQNLERNYRNYLSDLEANFDLTVSLKKKTVQFNSDDSLEEIAFNVLSFYIRHAFLKQTEVHNDSSIKKFIRYRLILFPSKKEESFIMEELYLFVFIRYAIQYNLKLEGSYKKLMSNSISTRRIYPCYLSTDSQYLTLVANDISDNTKKQFILANLHLKPKISLLNEFIKSQRVKDHFNYKKFKQSKEGRFQREEIFYKIRITSYSLEHLLLNYDFSIKILEDRGSWKIIELTTSDAIELQKALFAYDVYAILLEPKEEIQNFREKLQRILKENCI